MSDLNYPTKELNKMKHIEHLVTPDRTITEYKPNLLAKRKYVVFKLKKDKKTGEHYSPVYEAITLDSAYFVYNNLHILDVMRLSKRKTLLKLKSEGNDNLEKVLLLESDIDEQTNKKLTIAKAKDLKVYVAKQESDDLVGY